MERVLVTGASGFTARYVLPLLQRKGFDVHGVSSAQCDIRDAAALRDTVGAARPDYVIHLAGTPNLPDAQADTLYSVNVRGTLNLLEACGRLANPPRKVILASSSYVYGDTGSTPASERAALEAKGAYGKSKREMEVGAARWFDRLPLIIARPFNYTGVGHGERFLAPKLVSVFQERSPNVSFVDPTVIRDYSDVRWTAEAYVALLRSPAAGEAINICSGTGVPLTALVDVLENLTGRRAAVYPKALPGARRTALVGDPSRLLGLIGHRSPFSLRDTLSWMYDTAQPRPAKHFLHARPPQNLA